MPRWGPLPLADGGTIKAQDLRDKRAVVLVFMSNRCPGVKAYDDRLRVLSKRFELEGVQFLGVNSVRANHYPGEDLPGMAEAARERNLLFPYGKDPNQELAASVGAVCTPHVFVFDRRQRLRYRGRIDDRLVEAKAKKPFLANALEDVLGGRTVRTPETAPLGCAIEFARGPDAPPSHTAPAEAAPV